MAWLQSGITWKAMIQFTNEYLRHMAPHLLIWINHNPDMDK